MPSIVHTFTTRIGSHPALHARAAPTRIERKVHAALVADANSPAISLFRSISSRHIREPLDRIQRQLKSKLGARSSGGISGFGPTTNPTSAVQRSLAIVPHDTHHLAVARRLFLCRPLEDRSVNGLTHWPVLSHKFPAPPSELYHASAHVVFLGASFHDSSHLELRDLRTDELAGYRQRSRERANGDRSQFRDRQHGPVLERRHARFSCDMGPCFHDEL
ncbi:MAG: hypothetical protein NT113_25250 [Hyphomicrobiales bacterium]|nr:hypothetical protein [Hyphomicrobiales bacterium]